MNYAEVFSRWSGSPLVTASKPALALTALPQDSRDFLAEVGLPSNALWFDRNNNAIMCFDCVACLRVLRENDVSKRAWGEVATMKNLTILGVRSSVFIVADERGTVHMIDSDKYYRRAYEPGWRASSFVNQNVPCLLRSLLAYKDTVEVLSTEAYDFRSVKIRE